MGYFKSPCSTKEYLVAMNMVLQKRVHKLVSEIDTTWDITYKTLAMLLLQEECGAAALAAQLQNPAEWFIV